MSNNLQPRPKDTVDEQTIADNLKKMDYPPTEDIMTQEKRVPADLENTGKQVVSANDVAERKD